MKHLFLIVDNVLHRLTSCGILHLTVLMLFYQPFLEYMIISHSNNFDSYSKNNRLIGLYLVHLLLSFDHYFPSSRYFFKTTCTPDINKEQYVFRELTMDEELVPFYDGKIFVQLDRIS